jgi:hypothetical protein
LEPLTPILRTLGEQQPVEVRCVVNELQQVREPFDRHFVIEPVGERGAEDARAL